MHTTQELQAGWRRRGGGAEDEDEEDNIFFYRVGDKEITTSGGNASYNFIPAS
jgi:hypothetical protein